MDPLDAFHSYLLRKLYEKTSRNGDRLAEAEKQLDWEAFRPIIKPMYTNDTPRGGRPNTDEVVMMKLLVLQAWYGLFSPSQSGQVNPCIPRRRLSSRRTPSGSPPWRCCRRV